MGSINPKWINAVQNLPYGERQRVTNKSGSEIAKYALVTISPTGLDGNYGEIAAADPAAPSGHGKLGICLYKTIDDARTDIVPWAIIRDVDTSGATTVGDPIYLAASGAWSVTATASRRVVGKVLAKDATAGAILLDTVSEQSSLIVSGKGTLVGGALTIQLGTAMAGAFVLTSAATAGSTAAIDSAGEMVIAGSGTEVVSYIADGR